MAAPQCAESEFAEDEIGKRYSPNTKSLTAKFTEYELAENRRISLLAISYLAIFAIGEYLSAISASANLDSAKCRQAEKI